MFKTLSKLIDFKPEDEVKKHNGKVLYREVCRNCKCPNCWPNKCRALGIIK